MTNGFAAFPDVQFEVGDVSAEADRVALRVTVHHGQPVTDEALPMIMENPE